MGVQAQAPTPNSINQDIPNVPGVPAIPEATEAPKPTPTPTNPTATEATPAPQITTPAITTPEAETPTGTPTTAAENGVPTTQEIPKAIPVEDPPFIPIGGIAQLTDQADIDLFTKAKDVGHVQNNPALTHRRLVQRTIMPTEPVSKAGAVLTFDDYLVADSPSSASGIDIANDLAPLNTRAIFFANVNGVSGKDVSRIVKLKLTDDEKKAKITELLESQRTVFTQTIRDLLKIQGPADADGNKEYICEVYNHTAFHQDMTSLKLGTINYDICIIGIDFVESCIEAAYLAERPGWKRARYFRFPFLHVPKDKATKEDLNQVFTKHGLISLGETQDSKDFTNYSSSSAYKSLAAAKKNRRYNPKFGGTYGRADNPIALFHTKTWKKIKSGVIKAIKEN